jgi:hypothetical protein
MSTTEPCVSKCPGCGADVTTHWMKDNTGCVSRPEYVLVADWAWHAACWDKALHDHGQVAPPANKP